MSTFTPGPWSVPHFAKPEANCQCGYVLTESMFGAVCTVHASGDGDDIFANGDNPKFAEAVANAHLIASAPDLLEALELVRDYVATMKGYGHEYPTTIDAAIAKARGEA